LKFYADVHKTKKNDEGYRITYTTDVPCGLIPGLFRLSSLPFGDSCDVFGSHLRFLISFRLKAYCHASIPLP
jgi:hypothetical protein